MTQDPLHIVVQGPTCLLDPCLKAVPEPQLKLHPPRPGKMSAYRLEVATRVMQEVHVEVGERLRRQAWCYDDGKRRRVQLWNAVEVSVACDGTDLQARFMDGELEAGRYVGRADLVRPIGEAGFALAFMPQLVQACRHGPREGRLDPRVLPGNTGDWMREGIQRTWRGYVDWRRLRPSARRRTPPRARTR